MQTVFFFVLSINKDISGVHSRSTVVMSTNRCTCQLYITIKIQINRGTYIKHNLL